MAVTQYIGARYVPVFADPAEWSSEKSYEPLTIVLYEGNSFTSRQFVPVGVSIDNSEYWLETGNYNAQIEAYRQDVVRYGNVIPASDFDAVNTVKKYIDDGIVNATEFVLDRMHGNRYSRELSLYVAASGDDSSSTPTNQETPLRTIQAALEYAMMRNISDVRINIIEHGFYDMVPYAKMCTYHITATVSDVHVTFPDSFVAYGAYMHYSGPSMNDPLYLHTGDYYHCDFCQNYFNNCYIEGCLQLNGGGLSMGNTTWVLFPSTTYNTRFHYINGLIGVVKWIYNKDATLNINACNLRFMTSIEVEVTADEFTHALMTPNGGCISFRCPTMTYDGPVSTDHCFHLLTGMISYDEGQMESFTEKFAGRCRGNGIFISSDVGLITGE